MSKMVNLLNSAREIKEQRYAIAEPVPEPRLVPSAAAEKIYSAVAGIESGTGSPIVPIIMIITVLIAAASIYLSYQAIGEMHTNRTISKNLLQEHQSSEAKISNLENSLAALALTHEKETTELKTRMKELQEGAAQSTKTIADMKVDKNIMNSVVNDLKESNQKILKNLRSIEQQIQQLEQKVSQTEGNL